MIKKRHGKLICSILMLSLMSTTTITANAFTSSKSNKKNTNASTISAYNSSQYRSNFDANIGDTDRLIEMLKHEGIIPENATYEESAKLLQEYMHQRALNSMKTLSEDELHLLSKSRETQTAESAGKVTETNVLVLLADYADYTHNNVKPEETDMYYEDYNVKHYEDLLFSDEGYTTPLGKQCKSMRQYYLEQSNNTLSIHGKVIDWHQVDKQAAYYGVNNTWNGNDLRPGELVKDVLTEAAKDPDFDLSEFDKMDRYDHDDDGIYNEPDGVIDYLIVIHAGVGEDEGGGVLGADAIWAHRSSLDSQFEIPGTSYTDEDGNIKSYRAYDYTMNAEAGAPGAFCHEYGHDLGLPDEYDTQNSNEPVSAWSLMSYGSWVGETKGTEPPSISPYGKQMLQNIYGGGWQRQTVVNYEDLTRWGKNFKLTPASADADMLRINLPSIEQEIVKPYEGSSVYWGGSLKRSNASESMTTPLDLTNTTNPKLTFKTSYDIEEGWDYGSIQVRSANHPQWTCIKGNITRACDPGAVLQFEDGISGTSDGWIDAEFDLSAYAGENIELKFKYSADPAYFGAGFFIDNILISDGENIVFTDDAESDSKFSLNGFVKTNGIKVNQRYYLVELRDQSGVDEGLKHLKVNGKLISYDPGMVVWYADECYEDNWRTAHPGYGFLGVVDADQTNVVRTDGKESHPATQDQFQMHDAAFSNKLGSKFIIGAGDGINYVDNYRRINRHFNDGYDYSNSELPKLGSILPKYGINIDILTQSIRSDRMTIRVSRR